VPQASVFRPGENQKLALSHRMRVVDMTGRLPGWCAIDLVHERSPLSWPSVVWLIDRLHVPPSIAVALD